MSKYDDNSTVYVTQWLLHWKVPFERIDLEEKYLVEIIYENNDGFDFSICNDQKRIKMSEVKAVWYRRGDLNLKMPNLHFISNENLLQEVKEHLLAEKAVLEHFFYYLMKEKPHIGTFHERAVNKLRVLHEASKLGIEIPETLVATDRQTVLSYTSSDLISKSIYEGLKVDYGTGKYTLYTEKINKNTLPETFFLSLFQTVIDKEADIRSFYLDGKFYSMAIRSQSREQTTTNFRKYLKGVGNRSFPFQLPKTLEEKLHNLMVKIGLNTGSLDIILTKEGRFVFLEVNPVGQFGMTSIPCNYFLEKNIANKLREPLCT